MENIVQAKSKYINMTPRKVRLVVDMIRGQKAEDAVVSLKYLNKSAALPVRKCLESAIANAENNNDMKKSDLYVIEARVDEAPTFKRGRAVSRGRYHRILKRNCHIIIKVGLLKGAEEKIEEKTQQKESKIKESVKEDKKEKQELEIKKEKKSSNTKKETKTVKNNKKEIKS